MAASGGVDLSPTFFCDGFILCDGSLPYGISSSHGKRIAFFFFFLVSSSDRVPGRKCHWLEKMECCDWTGLSLMTYTREAERRNEVAPGRKIEALL